MKYVATITRPLQQLTENERPYNWTLLLFRPHKREGEFILETDTIKARIGAILCQKIKGEDYVLTYYVKVCRRQNKIIVRSEKSY